MKTVEYILPAYLASYLINGEDNITDSEKIEINSFITNNNLYTCLGVSDNECFMRMNDLNNIGGLCLAYSFDIK